MKKVKRKTKKEALIAGFRCGSNIMGNLFDPSRQQRALRSVYKDSPRPVKSNRSILEAIGGDFEKIGGDVYKSAQAISNQAHAK